MIPFSLGIALWVWRLESPGTGSVRLRCGIIVARVAALASVATSYPEPSVGITELGVSEEGTIYGVGWYSGQYISSDGGVTWAESDVGQAASGGVRSDDLRVDTPEGVYHIEGPDIVRVDANGSGRVVHSTRFMEEDSNLWTLEHGTSELGARQITSRPLAVVYDGPTGNLVVAMGIQGVLVGTPDGSWTPHPVGRYTPVDLSASGKTGLFLSNSHFWAMALALTLSMCGLALASSGFRMREAQLFAVVAVGTLLVVVGLPASLVATGQDRIIDQILGLFFGPGGLLWRSSCWQRRLSRL